MFASKTAAFFLILSAALSAQTALIQIYGKVLDNLGAPLPGAEIQAKDEASGKIYRSATDATEVFALSELPPGAYEFAVVVHGNRLYV
jgi:hypothetical protein